MYAETTVLVVGAGPTGLLLAAELLRRNVACHVIDAHPAPLHWDRATVVHPRTLELFEGLGIVEPLLTKGVKQRIARLHSQGAVLGTIDLSVCGSRYGFNIGISEEVTESILADYLRRQGGGVQRASTFTGLADHDRGLLATIQSDGATTQMLAQWVVGCDGLHSATRNLTGIDMIGHDIIQPWAVFDATVAGWKDSYEANYAYLDDIPVILTALPEERWRVYLRPLSPESDLVADATSTISRYLSGFSFDEVTNPTRFHCHTKVAERFRSGRVLLAGDAAHVCSPAQGHGMNTGLHDAINLAWKLALVCRGEASEALLDSYEAERRPVAETVTASGDAVEQAQMTIDPAARRERDEMLRKVFEDPNSRHHEAVAEAELDIDYGGSPIVMGANHDCLSPGQRLPDAIGVALADGRACMLHELTNGSGHTALLIDGLSASAEARALVEGSMRRLSETSAIIDKAIVLTIRSEDHASDGRIAPKAATELGINALTLLVIRPDGHIGLRSDDNHIEDLLAYQEMLVSNAPTARTGLR